MTLEEALAASYRITMRRDELGEDEPCWVAEIPDIPGCYGWGLTQEEAREHLEVTKRICLETRAEKGLPLPQPVMVKVSTQNLRFEEAQLLQLLKQLLGNPEPQPIRVGFPQQPAIAPSVFVT